MTRSFGDLIAKSVGVTYEPEVKEVRMDAMNKGHFVVIGSDGIWDRLSNEEVAKSVGQGYFER